MTTPNNNKTVKKAIKSQKINRLKLEPKFDAPRANASRQVTAFAETNKQYDHKRVKQYLKNTLVNSRPIRGPTFGAQSSSVAHLQNSGQIPANPDGDGAILFTNNPYIPVAYLKQSDTGFVESSYRQYVELPQEMIGCATFVDHVTVDGVKVPITMGHFLGGGSNLQYYDADNLWKSGTVAYPGKYTKIAGRVRNNSATAGNVGVQLRFWKSLDAPVQTLASSTLAVNNVLTSGDFEFNIATPEEGYYSVSFNRQSGNTQTIFWGGDFLEMTSAPGYKWTAVPLLETEENTLIREWIKTCSQVRIPAADLLVSNFNAEIYKNGKIGAVFIPPSEVCNIPDSPVECYRYITTSPQKIQKAVNMPLNEGLHVPWMGFDAKSFEFRQNRQGVLSEESALALSGWLISWRSNDATEFSQPLDFFINMTLEGITRQTILPALACPHILELWNEWNSFRSRHTLISENPKHLKHAAQVVGKFLKDKNNQEMLLKAGITIASALAAMI